MNKRQGKDEIESDSKDIEGTFEGSVSRKNSKTWLLLPGSWAVGGGE